MRVQLQSTAKLVKVNGIDARIWEGRTESGIEVHAFITRIAVHEDDDCSQFEAELQECPAPQNDDINRYPMRLIL